MKSKKQTITGIILAGLRAGKSPAAIRGAVKRAYPASALAKAPESEVAGRVSWYRHLLGAEKSLRSIAAPRLRPRA